MPYKDNKWERLPQIHQVLMNSWHILKKFLIEEEMVRYLNGWNPLSSKRQIKNLKDWHEKKRESSREEAPVTSTKKAQASQPPQKGKKNNKNNWRKPYSPRYRIPRIKKDAMENIFNMDRTLMEFKYK
ncbi:hypothetical protein O181_132825 [Austropuccinia psidii MF-1]|uniref:Uncharacterized protein n=1 Tax=Austropuccinia psidii MF-1 TaxID=1389203 RepID=A0A9Q3L7E6_9BASI|nr:hypothetical protein [Austropuccinia psidii MF-1]